jgi:predicted acyl esterase
MADSTLAETNQDFSGFLTGIFAGPVAGLKYQTPTAAGFTDERGAFHYRPGEAVTFLVGRLVLGTALGAPRINLAQLVNRVAGNIGKLHDPAVTNLARFLFTLDQDGDVENGVTIAPAVHDIAGARIIAFDNPPVVVAAGLGGPERFDNDPAVLDLLKALNDTPGAFTAKLPRKLCTGATARNALRRHITGIVKTTDVKIPTRDGSYVCADVFRPDDDGKHPVIMNMSFYGKSFYHECICNEEDAILKEEMEDRYFSGNPDGLQCENHESVNTSDWVPNGYVVIRIDSRGVCKSPGEQAPLSRQEAEDYYDAIEWAGSQPWSNGNVGLWGMSYVAMTQHNVASLQPSHLKAMIAQGTDSDPYNEYLSGGGLWAEAWWNWWWKIWSGHNHCGERRQTDWMARLKENRFDDPASYNPHGKSFMKPEMANATAAVWIVGPQTGAVIHQLGSSETFIRATGAKARKFDFTDAWFPSSYDGRTVAAHRRFFDHWLKGIDNGAMDGPPVRVQLRTGNAAYSELHEETWPIARTNYTRLYLDASPSAWRGDGLRRDFMRISATPPVIENSASYNAHLELGKPVPFPKGHVGGTPRWSTGISFVSDPLAEDMALVGYMKVGLWVASTSRDMDVHVSLRVIDEEDREVRYETLVMPIDPEHIFPVGYGCLKVSHRKLDTARSTEYWPVHTHAETDYAPLETDEAVAVELGLNPSTALVRKGQRLRLDIQPSAPAGIPSRAYDETYHRGATNIIYTGPRHPSYVQLPIIPTIAP